MSINFNVNSVKKKAKDIFVGVSGAKRRIIKVLTSVGGVKKTIYEYNPSGGIVGDFFIKIGRTGGSSTSTGSARIDIPFFKFIKSMRVTGANVDKDNQYYYLYFKYINNSTYKSLILFKTTTGNGVLDKTLDFTWGNDSLTINVTDNPNNTATGGDSSLAITGINPEDLTAMALYHAPTKITSSTAAYEVQVNFEVEYDFGE